MDDKRGWLKNLLEISGHKIAAMFLMIALWNILSKSFLFTFRIVPCKLFQEIIVAWGLCPLNPTILDNTLYFGVTFIDTVYVILYLLAIYIILPYVTACLLVTLYQKIMR